jgi:hypothetical protein
MDIRTPSTLAMARDAVARLGSIATAASVCKAAGFRVGRPYLSRYLNNNLDKVANVETAILACFDRHSCRYLGMTVDSAYCREINTGPVPTWDPAALDQRRCCQTCPHKPESEGAAK